MLALSCSMWRDYSESPDKFVRTFYAVSGLSFSTGLPGGFTSCSFSVPFSFIDAAKYYQDYLNYHVVVFDFFGRRVWEGYVATSKVSLDGLQLDCTGYYAHANDLTHGIIYPISVPTSASDIIIDTCDLSTKWTKSYENIDVLTADITPQDFTGEAKLMDAIERVCQYGDDAVSPSQMYFAIWENRTPFFKRLPDGLTGTPKWSIRFLDIVDQRGLALSRDRSGLYNKLQVIFDDPDIGQTFTDWFQDSTSQSIYGVREGSINIGESLPGIADTIAELAIARYAYPTQQINLAINGIVGLVTGGSDYPYMIRAGDLVRIVDFDPDVVELVIGNIGRDIGQVAVTGTRYSADSNVVELEFGDMHYKMDIILARIGMSNIGVR